MNNLLVPKLDVMQMTDLFEMRFYLLNIKKLHTEENGQELDQRGIGVWKYVRTGINAYLKNQVENYSKIDNSVK